ncbi:uncharacterized protein DS421_19g674590 [Arachis hypogaea]|uniref:Uncharacterized protein n=1 Tax=Arachis hypogaea TaxID=3818 RepID=A0A6B9VGI3_ARAHY|nr:uncharacterized protein DS421_19g674590 [Arachis hypogaea]
MLRIVMAVGAWVMVVGLCLYSDEGGSDGGDDDDDKRCLPNAALVCEFRFSGCYLWNWFLSVNLIVAIVESEGEKRVVFFSLVLHIVRMVYMAIFMAMAIFVIS